MACGHCMVARDGADLPLSTFRRILQLAAAAGRPCLSLTGGEPSLHPQIGKVLEAAASAGLRFLLIGNGWNFASLLPVLLEHSGSLLRYDLSLDGASEQVHDSMRRDGSYGRVLDAAQLCRSERIPFGLRSMLTRRNLSGIEEAVRLAESLGAEQMTFIPPLPTRKMAESGTLPSPVEMMGILPELERVRRVARIPVVPAVGLFNWNVTEPCPTLGCSDLFVTARGELGFCCSLVSYDENRSGTDRLGLVAEMEPSEAIRIAGEAVNAFKLDKQMRFENGRRGPLDYFPCWYCMKRFRKVEWLREVPDNPWAADLDSV